MNFDHKSRKGGINVKNNDRKESLVKIAFEMFLSNGYENTSVDKIIEEAKIAKGTFYYYFESKEQLLEEVVGLMLDNQSKHAEEILNSNISIPEKIVGIILSYTPNEIENTIKNTIHNNENIVLHQKLNKELIERMIPILTEVVKDGNKVGIFNCDNIPERIKSILILSGGLFDDNKKITKNDIDVFIDIIEKTLGAKSGTMNFINKIIER